MNQVWVKIVMIAGAIAVVVALIMVVKWQHDIINKQTAIEKSMIEMKQLGDGIVRAQAQYASKDDLEKFAKQNNVDLSPIKNDLERLNAQIQGISVAAVSTPGGHQINMPSTNTIPRTDGGSGSSVIPCPSGGSVTCPDPFGYLTNTQAFAINEPFADGTKIPFGETQFKAWQEHPWDLRIFPRKYSATTVLGQDEEGRHYTYHKFAIESNGKSYPVKIDDAKFVEEVPEAKFRFSPRLYLGIDVGTYVNPAPKAEVTPNLQVAFFSYGKVKPSPSWTILGVGLGFETQSSRLGVVLSPVNYNVGQHLPLVQNLFVGPTVSFDTAGSFAVMGGLHVGL